MTIKTMNFFPVLLASQTPLGRIGRGTGLGPWSNLGTWATPGTAASAFAKIISNIIGVMTIIAGIWFIFQLIIGAYEYLGAGGSEEQLKRAQKRLTNAVIGLVIVVAAYALISLLGALLGLDILNVQDLIGNLGP